ncbi:hypothetical protein D9619_011207 [Psilocybe cf. subviscida]|uniref:Cytochrome P450 n=1 Tax=Psilocybe cf. subviscida TaxID=2480587 RepID=A0A8H5BIP0_9AGAR|nr:hypothetical protein D9619_011207 [Psilocybe cf. subviscida]
MKLLESLVILAAISTSASVIYTVHGSCAYGTAGRKSSLLNQKGFQLLAMSGVSPPLSSGKYIINGRKSEMKHRLRFFLVRDTAGALVGAASETTVSIISSCILGLLQNPSNIIRAQAELDKVIPPGYLPDFDHESKLPFITAFVYEAQRWRDIVPLGISHKTSQDDVYKGYHIPAGTMVMANMWAMLHDETAYPDPFSFNPSRFMKGDVLDEDVRNPGHACWGFGRRMCPGRHVAYSAIWIAIASILFCFDIQKARDEQGRIIEPLDEISFGLTWDSGGKMISDTSELTTAVNAEAIL